MKVVHSDDITTNAVPADQRIHDVQLMLCQLKPHHTAIASLTSLTPRSAEPITLCSWGPARESVNSRLMADGRRSSPTSVAASVRMSIGGPSDPETPNSTKIWRICCAVTLTLGPTAVVPSKPERTCRSKMNLYLSETCPKKKKSAWISRILSRLGRLGERPTPRPCAHSMQFGS